MHEIYCECLVGKNIIIICVVVVVVTNRLLSANTLVLKCFALG